MAPQPAAAAGLSMERIVAEFESGLTRYALHLVSDLDVAREVVQETFLALWLADTERIGNYYGPWLFTVCRNRAIDRLRKERRMDPLDGHEAMRSEAPGLAPSALAEVLDEHQRVLAAMGDLPARQREVLNLKVLSQLSYREISSITGLSESNVGYLIHVAIHTLRDRLQAADARLAQSSKGGSQ